MITTDSVPGSPAWLDLGSRDITATASFYGPVFGWEFESAGPDSGYGFFKLRGKTVAAVGGLTEEGARSAWIVYFRTRDADMAARTVEQRGGTVRAAPSDIDGEGRMAQFSDPQGGQFAVWQPGGHAGLEAVDVPGSLTWTELCTPDAGAAKEFYGSLFGWRTQDMPMPGDGEGTYTLLMPEDGSEDLMHGGIVELPAEYLTQTGGSAYWHPVFGTEDCDAVIARVRDGGGSVTMGPEDAEGVGRLAVCNDPAGAEFVVLKPAEM
ncbi:VOC family protein [Streptomyces armeniacus]|uniref:VOC family protein n=1 Tax=Streptomyces armeniacus TaxID=83291 RepID=A0A345XPL2_9ACTN|nr:VOC family protein [Streptomyces armeniacus]AXK33578.1 VOC family protein [Streptomyces armeniacus]